MTPGSSIAWQLHSKVVILQASLLVTLFLIIQQVQLSARGFNTNLCSQDWKVPPPAAGKHAVGCNMHAGSTAQRSAAASPGRPARQGARPSGPKIGPATGGASPARGRTLMQGQE
jgi:hypothetical protein